MASHAPNNPDIFISGRDGSHARPLLPHPAADCDASFSPAGQWVVFTSHRTGQADIYRVQPDGSGLERLADDPAFDDQGVLSADRKSELPWFGLLSTRNEHIGVMRMKRRDFIKATSLSAVAVSTSGFVFRMGSQYVGDCETTTDILGPFYRPDSPVRNNLLVKGETGNVVELTGVVKHNDCISPYANAKVELWHCNDKGEYDNSSDEFKYRGTTFTDAAGNYSFKTIVPVPYDVGDGTMRPAHFHLMITASGYQPLITQLYFTGDPFIAGDASASDAAASRRILKIDTLSSGMKRVSFDVSMSPKRRVSLPVLQRLAGTYFDESDKTKTSEFFTSNDQFWRKNGLFGNLYEYVGDNTFLFKGITNRTILAHFDILPDKATRLTETITSRKGDKHTSVSYRHAW